MFKVELPTITQLKISIAAFSNIIAQRHTIVNYERQAIKMLNKIQKNMNNTYQIIQSMHSMNYLAHPYSIIGDYLYILQEIDRVLSDVLEEPSPPSKPISNDLKMNISSIEHFVENAQFNLTVVQLNALYHLFNYFVNLSATNNIYALSTIALVIDVQLSYTLSSANEYDLLLSSFNDVLQQLRDRINPEHTFYFTHIINHIQAGLNTCYNQNYTTMASQSIVPMVNLSRTPFPHQKIFEITETPEKSNNPNIRSIVFPLTQFSGHINNERLSFVEHIIEGDGDCAVTALNKSCINTISRNDISCCLLSLSDDPDIRQRLQASILDGLTSGDLKNDVWRHLNEKRISLQRQYDNLSRRLKENDANYPQNTETNELTSLDSLRKELEQIENEINNHITSKSLFQDYATAIQQSKFWIDRESLCIYAEKNYIQLYIWEKLDSQNKEKLHIKQQSNTKKSAQEVHLIFLNGNHFNCLTVTKRNKRKVNDQNNSQENLPSIQKNSSTFYQNADEQSGSKKTKTQHHVEHERIFFKSAIMKL